MSGGVLGHRSIQQVEYCHPSARQVQCIYTLAYDKYGALFTPQSYSSTCQLDSWQLAHVRLNNCDRWGRQHSYILHMKFCVLIRKWRHFVWLKVSCSDIRLDFTILFAMVSDSSVNSWESWFIFNLQKMNTNQYYESVPLNVRNCKHITRTRVITWEWAYNNYCTYLNSHLLGAPRENALHGLVPGLNWVPSWPLPLSMYLVAMPNPVSCCLLQWVGFHT
jgi:hypothetical protein